MYVSYNMSLQFTSIDDAFAPLQTKRRKREDREDREERDETYEKKNIIIPPRNIHSQEPVLPPSAITDDLTKMQPYLCMLFMIVVTGMLYDIRNAIMDARNILHDIYIKRSEM